MNLGLVLLVVAGLSAASFLLARRRALGAAGGDVAALHSLPGYYGWYAALWCGLPGLLIALTWVATASWALEQLTLAGAAAELAAQGDARVQLFLNDVRNLAAGNIASGAADATVTAAAARYQELRNTGLALTAALAVVLSLAGAAFALGRVEPGLRARPRVERFLHVVLMACSTLAILITIGIVLSLIFETARFFQKVPVSEFLFGTHWSPQTALRSDQVGSSGSFGAVPVFVGTLLITGIAMSVAVPIGLMSAIYMTFYAAPRVRALSKPILEVLAGIPTVVYGFFAALVVAPLVRGWGESIGLDVASESALAAGLVMGVMIIPFISSLSDDAITAVPTSLRDGSFGLGATRSETIRFVIIPGALPGIVGAFLLAISRAIGETMIVVMAAGLAANLTLNPLAAVTTVTVQIVTLLTGDQEFDSAKTLSAFALGLVLFVVTLGFNLLALRIVQKYRERYD
jgi:phosphate transport system permease protein